jgi:hypothetical protein
LKKPSKSLQTIITTSSLLKNQNKYLPHFKCPLKNTTTNGATISKTYAINDLVVGGIKKDDDVMRKESVFFNR